MALLSVNYSRVEGRFPMENLVKCSTRRALNLTEDWLLSVVSEDDWNNHYKDVLSVTFDDEERMDYQHDAWGEPDEEGRGEFILERNEDASVSNFNFSGTAKP